MLIADRNIDQFFIAKRQHAILAKQVIENHPNETGGFIGGKGDHISAILPVRNKATSSAETTFVITSEDIQRAHAFFEKHGLEYIGTYHSHPSGELYPSAQDMTHVQAYLFILVINKKRNAVEIAGFRQDGAAIVTIPVTKTSEDRVQQALPTEKIGTLEEQMERLNQMMYDVKRDQLSYPKFDVNPLDEDSNFTTLA